MIRTVTIDIINDKAMLLLQDLELLQLIRVRKEKSSSPKNQINLLKGALSKEDITQVDQQLNELRAEWD